MRVMTSNIRATVFDDGENNWRNRAGLCVRVIASRAPDILCFQEMCADQFADIRAAFPDFEPFAMLDGPETGHPLNAVFYARERFRRIDQGGYWLSETPHVPASVSWGSNFIRLANWLRLEERASGSAFRIVSTHLDYRSEKARENQMRMLNEDAAAYPEDLAQILAGDFNADVTSAVLEGFLAAGWRDSYAAVHGQGEPGHTMHGFKGPLYDGLFQRKIDWILVKGPAAARASEIVRDHEAARYPSDHYFVLADIELGPNPSRAG